MNRAIIVSQVDAQLSKMNATLEKDIADAKQLKTAIQWFVSDRVLQGDAYQAAKDYFESTHIQILSQIISVCEMLLAANKRYSACVHRNITKADKVEERELRDQIRSLRLKMQDFEYAKKEAERPPVTPDTLYTSTTLGMSINMTNDAIKVLEEILEGLETLDYESNGFYAEEKAAMASLASNIKALNTDARWDSTTNMFMVPKGLNLKDAKAAIEEAINKGKKYDVAYDGDPVNMVTGNYIYEKELLKQTGRTPLSFILFYNSADDGEACLGSCGFTHNHQIYLTEGNGKVTLTLGDGRREIYEKEEGRWKNQAGNTDRSLGKTEDGFCYETEEQQSYQFDLEGKLLRQENKQGSGLTYTYDQEDRLETVQSNAGTGLAFTYDSEHRITQITDLTERKILFTYEKGTLSKLITEEGGAFTYAYDKDKKITTVTNPRGITTVTNLFDGNFRVKEQTFPDGGTMSYAYNDRKQETILTEQNGNQIKHIHDEKGRSTRVIYFDGEEITKYNDQNQKTSITDKNGNETDFSYDNKGNLKQVIDPLGQKAALSYDENKNLKSLTLCGKRLVEHRYDEKGNLISEKDGLRRETQITYNPFGQPVQILQPDGSELHFAYDSHGNLTKMTDATGAETCYQYDKLNRVIATTDGKGNKTAYTWDKRGNLLTVTNPAGKTQSYSYNESDKITGMVDFDGHATRQEYNELNKPSKIIDKNGQETLLAYDKMWNIQWITDPAGNETMCFYDKRNRLIEVSEPEMRSTKFSYDPNGNRTKIEDPMGHTTSFTYDALNRIICETDANGAETKTEYDVPGNVSKTIDPLGNAACTEYDTAGQKIKETDILGNTTTYTYTPLGQVDTITDHKGRKTIHEYLPGGLLQKVTNPDGTWESYTYDLNGNVVTQENQDGAKVTFTYDSLDQIIKTKDQDGNESSLSYDGAGNITAKTDPNGNTTKYQYTPMGQLLSVTDPLGFETSYGYDLAGQLTQINQTCEVMSKVEKLNKEQKGLRLTRYERDKAGRVTKVMDALGNEEDYVYNKRGEVIQKTDRDGYETKYDYDPVGNLSGITYADGKTVKYQYNALRQLLEVQDWLGSTKIERDDLGRETAITDHRGTTVDYCWNDENLPEKIQYPDGTSAQYVYDDLSRLKELKAGAQTATYRYDSAGRLTEKVLTGGITTEYKYNSLGRLARLIHRDRESTLDQSDYIYDGIGNIMTVEKFRRGLPEESGRYNYSYDALYRLTGVEKDGKQISNYCYDLFGNRTSMEKGAKKENYEYNTLNQLIRREVGDQVKDYVYDKRGNLIEVIEQGRKKHHYQFDAMSRLKQTINSTGEKTEYQYNGFGCRVGKVDVQNPTAKIEYVLDLTRRYNNVLQKKEGQSTQNFYWDEDVAFMNEGGNGYAYLRDELGSPERFLTQAGKEIEAYGYDEFGQDLYGNQGKLQPFGYTGYQFDPVTDTYFAQLREYKPGAGRFISEDPIKQGDNWYSYCDSRPLIHTDPMGLDAILVNKEIDNFKGLEHMSGFFQDKKGNWYFFFWGDNVKIEPVSEEDAKKIFKNKKAMNKYLLKNGLNERKDKPYIDSVYIKGDFSESVKQAHRLEKLFKDGVWNYNRFSIVDFLITRGLGLPNKNYGFFKNNCTQVTMTLFMQGILPNGMSVEDYMKTQRAGVERIPNWSMINMQRIFYNSALNIDEFNEAIAKQRSKYVGKNWFVQFIHSILRNKMNVIGASLD